MIDIDKDTAAGLAGDSVPVTAAQSPGASITGSLLFVTSFVICALFIAEAIFGLLWALGGEFRTYASFFR